MPSFGWGRQLSQMDWGLLTALTVGLILISVLSVHGRRNRIVIFCLRVVFWICVWVLFVRPSLIWTKQELLPRPLAVVVDRSLSMTLPTGPEKTRWDEVRTFLENQKIWSVLKQDFELSTFSLSEGLVPITPEGLLAEGKPDGNHTHLIRSIRPLLADSRWAGVLLVSDGVDTEEMESGKAILSPVPDVPLVVLFPSEPEGLVDAAVLGLYGPEFGYLKQFVEMEAEISLKGVDREGVQVRLLDGERVVASSTAKAAEWDGDRGRIKLSFLPDRPGPWGLTCEIQSVPREVTYENNRKSAIVQVLRDRARVLHVAGRPTWDERFLRGYLKEKPNLDLISFFILRSIHDRPGAEPDELSLIPFPYHELFSKELHTFDLVIFQNFDFRTYFESYYLSNVRNYVEGGGAFLMIGGDLSFGRGGYANSPIEEILPVQMRSDPDEIASDAFRPVLTPEAERHPIFQGRIHARDVQSLPLLTGLHRVSAVKPGATVLLADSKQRLGNQPAPVFVTSIFGKGRVAALLADSLWRWGFSERPASSAFFRGFWDSTLRWLLPDSGSPYLKIFPQSRPIAGDLLAIEIRALDFAYLPLPNAELRFSWKNGNETLNLAKTDASGLTRTSITPPSSGILELQVTRPGYEERGYNARELFIVAPKNFEFERRDVNVEELTKWASSSKGSIHSLRSSLPAKFEAFYRQARYRSAGQEEYLIWDQWLTLVLMLSVASFEWWFRRRHGGA